MNNEHYEPGGGNIADAAHQHIRQMARTRVVGQKERRVDARPLVTGAPVYAAEFEQPNMLHARILHSPHAHANILSIDKSQALALPGVYAVLTYEDLPRVAHSTAGQPYPELSPYDAYLLDSRVRYVGDWVAFVAAETPAIAEEALSLIHVEYEILPAVFDPLEAMRDGAPQLHEPDSTHPNFGQHLGDIYDASHNIAAHEEIHYGDLDTAMREADIVVEGEYRVPFISHAVLEPHVCTAYVDGYDRLIVVSSTQVPYHTRRQLAAVLQLPISRIRVVKPRVGGGFGSKQEMLLEPVAAALALKTRQPVRIEYSRQEEFTAGRFRHPMIMRMRSGVKRDGTLVAISMHSIGNAGAYGTHSFTVTRSTGHKTLCLYRAKAYAFTADAIYTNLPITGAMRGYGAPQGFFALESHIDEIARRLNMNPLEFRKKNHVQRGDWDPMEMHEVDGEWHSKRQFRSCGLPQCLERGAAAFGWYEPFDRGDGEPIRRGRGMATAMQGSGVASFELGGASIKLNEDGSFNVMTGATDIGQGSDTILAQIAAEALGVGMDKIIMHSVDTDSSVFDYGSYASSTTYISGGGVKVAAERVRKQILDVAGDMLDCAPEDMSIVDGTIYTPRGPSSLTVADIANETLYGRHRQQIMAKGDFWTDDSPAPFFAQFVEVEIDTETGQVRVPRAVNVLDLGKAINPTLATGQVEGAVTMALGYALSEEVKFDEQGRVRNPGFVDYKVMSTLDMPQMTTILVEDTEYTGPFGAKSAGEVPTNGMAPAIANAIHDALGVRIRDLPITPEKILRALDEKGRPH
ncbi:MAG TPA: molybdopterin cofactor-binding domain-containing protein [Ktedonobacteraceae bacterium]|nr:molybdopterin cofactor-binding domain-containing protein [Ktedonobacteraceae bacterium]